jgi:hypothetical protein
MAEDGTSCIAFFTSTRIQTFPLWLDPTPNQTPILDPACDHEALATHHEDFHHLVDPSTGSSSVGHPYRTKTLSALPDQPVDGVERGVLQVILKREPDPVDPTSTLEELWRDGHNRHVARFHPTKSQRAYHYVAFQNPFKIANSRVQGSR